MPSAGIPEPVSILVTGAAGKTGRAVVDALTNRGALVRAFVRTEAQGEALRPYADPIAGDMRDPEAWTAALAGATAMYLICPNMMPDERQVAALALRTADLMGVRRVVYHSVLHPQVEAMPHHWNKMRVEEMLFTTSLDWTVLQPAAYMQNVFGSWAAIARDGMYRVPYGVETRLGMVDLADVAEIAATVLLEDGHMGAIYELAGPEAMTQTGIAAILSSVMGRPVRAERISTDAWEAGARSAGLDDLQIETLLAMFRYYDRHGFWGNPRVLEWLLGRAPTTFIEAAQRESLSIEK